MMDGIVVDLEADDSHVSHVTANLLEAGVPTDRVRMETDAFCNSQRSMEFVLFVPQL